MSFSHQHLLMIFHWILCDSRSIQVSSILLGILADFSIAIVSMVSTRLPISNFSNPFTKVTVPSATIIIGITATFIFHYYYHFTSCEFFSPVSANGLSLESE